MFRPAPEEGARLRRLSDFYQDRPCPQYLCATPKHRSKGRASGLTPLTIRLLRSPDPDARADHATFPDLLARHEADSRGCRRQNQTRLFHTGNCARLASLECGPSATAMAIAPQDAYRLLTRAGYSPYTEASPDHGSIGARSGRAGGWHSSGSTRTRTARCDPSWSASGSPCRRFSSARTSPQPKRTA